jgi:predicted deacylase
VPRATFDSAGPERFAFTVPTQGAGRPTHFATWVPYPLSRHTGLLEQLRDARDIGVVEIGRSVQGRPIHAVILGSLDRPRIAVSAGMHGAETTGMHAAAGALKYLTSAAGHDLREAARYAFIPIVNVDAQATGLDRRNAAGVNLWLDAAAPDQPEVRALTSFLEEFAPDAYLDYHSWHWGGDGCYMPGWGVVGDTLYGRVLALRASVERHFAMTAQIFTADDDSCWTARAARLLRTPTLTVETSLGAGTDGVWKSLERVEQDGVAALHGAVEYVATAMARNEAPTPSP